jgi:hypothetical protein
MAFRVSERLGNALWRFSETPISSLTADLRSERLVHVLPGAGGVG